MVFTASIVLLNKTFLFEIIIYLDAWNIKKIKLFAEIFQILRSAHCHLILQVLNIKSLTFINSGHQEHQQLSLE